MSTADTALSAGSSAGLASAVGGVDRRDDVVGVLQAPCRPRGRRAGRRGPGRRPRRRPATRRCRCSPPVPEEPDSPQAAVSSSARARGAMNRVRVRMGPPSVSRGGSPATRVWREDSRGDHATPAIALRAIDRSNALRFCYRRARRSERARREAVGSGVADGARPRRPGTAAAAGPASRAQDTSTSEQLGQQRQRGDEEGAGDDQAVVLLAEAELDEPAEPSRRPRARPGRRWRRPARPPSGCRS